MVNENRSKAAINREAAKRARKDEDAAILGMRPAKMRSRQAAAKSEDAAIPEGQCIAGAAGVADSVDAFAEPVTALAVEQCSRVAETAAVVDLAEVAIAVGQGVTGVADDAEVVAEPVTALAKVVAEQPSTFAEALVSCVGKAAGTLTELEKSALKVSVGESVIEADVMERWTKELDDWTRKEFGRGYVEEWLHRGGSAAFARDRASASSSSRGTGSG